jgi:hypothetical protein
MNTRLPCKLPWDGILIAVLISTQKCSRKSTQRHCGQVEQGISNDEVWNRFAQLLYHKNMVAYLTSTFIIQYSIFDI